MRMSSLPLRPPSSVAANEIREVWSLLAVVVCLVYFNRKQMNEVKSRTLHITTGGSQCKEDASSYKPEASPTEWLSSAEEPSLS